MWMEDGKNRLQVEKIKIANEIIKINRTFSLFSNVKMLTGLIINFGMGHLGTKTPTFDFKDVICVLFRGPLSNCVIRHFFFHPEITIRGRTL